MAQFLFDLRLAFRGLRHRAPTSLAALAVLSLGIGASVAVFTLVHAIVRRPLPYSEPERLVRIYQSYPKGELRRGAVSRPDFDDWAAGASTIASMGAYSRLAAGFVLAGSEPYEVATTSISEGFFETLGRPPELGRWPTAGEIAEGAPVVVLSHAFWQRRFGADPGLVGSTVDLDGVPYAVIGVMPADFAFPDATTEAWASMARIDQESIPWKLRFVRWLAVVARLEVGTSLEEAESELSTISARLASADPESANGAEAVTVVGLDEVLLGSVRPALRLLWGAVELVLLVACANVAHLLLAAGIRRRREIALKAAVGASRSRLVGQLLVESLLLAGGAAAIGLALASWIVEVVLRSSAGLLPRAAEVAIDGQVVAFAVASAALTTLIFGLGPALRATRTDLVADLAAEGRAGAGVPHVMARRLLVTTEVALAAALAIGAGLLGKSFLKLTAVDPGFDPGRIAVLTLTVPDATTPEQTHFLEVHRRISERLRALPGVVAVGSSRALPVAAEGERFPFTHDGEPEPAPEARPWAQLFQVTPSYFRTLGVPLVAGRDLDETDTGDRAPVLLVNESAARRFWPGASPVGRRIHVGRGTAEVVGVVGDVRHAGLREPAPPAFYISLAQNPRRVFTFAIRAEGDPRALLPALKAAVADVDRTQPITALSTMDDLLAEEVARPRFFASMLGAFAVLGLVLAASGAYGVVAVLARERGREIGVRMAFGADRAAILRLLVGEGLPSVLLGVTAGVGLALAAGRFLESQLFEVAPADPAVIATVAATLVGAALAATYPPARRAARKDAGEALR